MGSRNREGNFKESCLFVLPSLCVPVDFRGRVEFGEEGFALRCTRSSIWFASEQPIFYMFTCFGIALSLFFFFTVFEMSVLGWGDEIQCTSCADACELQGFRLWRWGGRDDDKEPANVSCIFRPCTSMQCNLGRWCFHTYWFLSVCREQKIGGEHAHVGQVKSCAHMEKNLALHLFLHPWSVSPPLSFVKFCIFWCSHMLCSQSSLAHDRGFSRVYVEMGEWLRVAICL
jgi:hypothetical protein